MTNCRYRWMCVAIFISALEVVASPDNEPQVFFETPAFSVTKRDLELYLSAGGSDASDLREKSAAAINQGLSDLYALKVLATEAVAEEDLISQEELDWIAEFAVVNELVKRILRKRLDDTMAGIDIEQIALEEYTANPDRFALPETVVVRTLLLRPECESVDAATERLMDLLKAVKTEDEFIQAVEEHTEDDAARADGGLIRVTRGSTVRPFEEAAFSMSKPGEISDPVVTEFGVHALYFLERIPRQIPPFSTVKRILMPEIEERTRNNVLDDLRMHGRVHRPDGLIVHQEAIDAFLADLKN